MVTPKQLGLKPLDWRENQANTIDKLRLSGSDITILDAPTGSGKSLIALGTILSGNDTGYTLTQTKSLQYQYVQEGNGIVKMMIGRSNYPCALSRRKLGDEERELREVLGEMGCTCKNKMACPYQKAKQKALGAQIAALNYSYWFKESESVGAFSGVDWIFADEGHLLDGVLSDFATTRIPKITINKMKGAGLQPPNSGSGIGAWIEYAKAAATTCLDQLTDASLDDTEKEILDRRRRLFLKFSSIEANLAKWVAGEGVVRPIWPPSVGDVLLGKEKEKGKRLVIMSATILDPDMFTWLLGIQGSEYISIPWTFTKENRPIYYRPVADMTQSTQVVSSRYLASAIDGILDKRKGEKGVIHTRSFTLGELIYKHLRNTNRIVYHGRTQDRNKLIQQFKQSKRDVWLMSPSVSHGEDFKYDMARCQIITKMPYPDLSDPVVRARMRQKPDWYAYATIQDTIQMIGRVSRAEDDYGESWVLDGKFGELMDKYNKFVPQEIEEAIV